MKENYNCYDLICVVTNDLVQERRMTRICETLARRGWRVLLMGRELPDSQITAFDLIDVLRVKCTYNKGPLFYFEIIMRFRSELKKMEYKRLLFVDLDTALLSKFIKKKNRAFIIDLHEYFEKVPELQNNFIKRKCWSLIGQWTMPEMDRIMTVNQSLADIFKLKYRRDVSVLRNVPSGSISIERSYPPTIQTVYLGVLNPGRGLEELIDAFRDHPQISLKIIGDGPEFERFQLLAKNINNIHFTGAIRPDRISSELKSATYGWNLLDATSDSYYYSLANKFFDYLAHGIPVITMDFPEYRKIIREYNCGIMVQDLQAPTLHNVLEYITNNSANWSQLHRGSLLAAQQFNWENEEEKLLSLLDFQSNKPL